MKPKQMMKKVLLFVAASCLGLGVKAATPTIVTDPASPVDIVASGYNGYTDGKTWNVSTANHALKFSGNATITLAASAASSGVFTLYANVFATNGTVTVAAESGISKIRWIGGIEAKKVVVTGATAIDFGDTMTSASRKSATSFSYFGVDEFEFGGTFTFVNAATLAKLPTCAYTIADGTHIGVAAKELLGTGGTFMLTNFDIAIVNVQCIKADTIVVPNGRHVSVFPCAVQFGDTGAASYNLGRWAWGGLGHNTIAYDFAMSAGSSLGIYGSQVNQTFSGDLSGTTDFTLAHTATKLPANVNFTGRVELGGTVTLSSCSSIHCNGNGPFRFGDLTCADYATKGNTFTFVKAANGSIGTLTGGIKVVGDDKCSFAVGALAAGAQLDVDGAVKVSVASADETATVNLLGTDGGWTVSGPTDAALALNLVPASNGYAVNLGGKLTLGDLGDKFSAINLLAGAELSGTTFNASTKITGQGKVVYTGTSWKDKIYFWADGSKADSMVPVREEYPGYKEERKPVAKISGSNTEYDIIYDWKDCRGSDIKYMIRSWRATSQEEYNTMGSSPVPTYPFFASNVYVSATAQFPGYMSFAGANAGSRQATLCKYNDDKEIWEASSVKTPYAIVVFGSQQGGGAGILATYDESLARTYSTKQADASNPMFTAKNYKVYADGAEVADSTVTGLNGGWQILSINTENCPVRGLGSNKIAGNYAAYGTNRGYSNYAEVMLFSAEPTEIERKVIEENLATKWGLSCAHSGTKESISLNVEVGGTAGSAMFEYPNDDIPREFTVNANIPENFKRGVRYPIATCSSSDTVKLGTVTGRSLNGLRVLQEAGVVYLFAPRSGFVVVIQ